MSQDGTNERVSAAVFRAETAVELRHIWRQIDLLWRHNAKRRNEIASAEDRLAAQIDAIRARSNSAVLWFAVGAAGIIFNLMRHKLGF